MNPWRRGPLTVNPYDRTAFAVTGVPPDVVRRQTVVGIIGQTRRVVKADPHAHELVGGPVTEPELNAAEQVLLDPLRRVLEELLTHAVEEMPLDGVRELAGRVAAALAPVGPPPLTDRGRDALVGLVAARFLAEAPPADPSFGALELALVRPFGNGET